MTLIYQDHNFKEQGYDLLPTSPRYWDLEIISATPISSPLSSIWKVLAEYDLGKRKIIFIPLLYLGGMIGFSFAIPYRFIRSLVALTLVIYSSIKWAFVSEASFDPVKFKLKLLRLYTLRLFSATFGIICPPAAYKLDRKINYMAPEGDVSRYFFRKAPLKSALISLNFQESSRPSLSEIKKRYYKLSTEMHPDKNKGQNSKAFIKISEAYGLLNKYYLKDPV